MLDLVREDREAAANERVAVNPACTVAKLVDSILDHADLDRVEARQSILVRHDRHRARPFAFACPHYALVSLCLEGNKKNVDDDEPAIVSDPTNRAAGQGRRTRNKMNWLMM